mgnify:CR=1
MIIRRQLGEKGQVVIPKDIRDMLRLREGEEVVFEVVNNEVKIKPEQDPEEFLEDFLNVPKPKKNLTLKDLREIEEESYDLP